MSKTWQSIGPHRFCTEGDTIYWSMVGFMEEAHTKQLLATVDAALAKFHRSVLLVDCTLAHGLKPEARRCYAEWLKHNPHPHRASIFYCVHGDMRTFLVLVQNGGQLVSKNRSAIEIVEDEAAAHRRANELRAQWSAQSTR